jgi:hypothetical protein
MMDHMKSEHRKKFDFVRLDMDFANPRLRALYEGMAFIKAGRKRTSGKGHTLYGLKVASLRSCWTNMRVT